MFKYNQINPVPTFYVREHDDGVEIMKHCLIQLDRVSEALALYLTGKDTRMLTINGLLSDLKDDIDRAMEDAKSNPDNLLSMEEREQHEKELNSEMEHRVYVNNLYHNRA